MPFVGDERRLGCLEACLPGVPSFESERFVMTSPAGVSRRTVIAASAAAAATPLAFSQAAQAHGRGGAPAPEPQTFHLPVLGTSDTHGNVYNWDYYRDAEYDDAAHNDVGVAKLAA